MNKVWTAEEIRENIINNDKWAIRGLIAIYNYQTEYEQRIEETTEWNGVGFNGADGKFMTSVAKFFLARNYLTEKQIYLVRKRLVKYCGQLARIANNKI